jgi:hypothetical protein
LCSFDILQWHEPMLNSRNRTRKRLLELNDLKSESVVAFSHQCQDMYGTEKIFKPRRLHGRQSTGATSHPLRDP